MYVARTNSTNTLLRELIAKGEWPEGEEFLYTGYQTAGRGQTGNGWESEEGKNLLCSILLEPRANLFELNIFVAVAVHRLVSGLGIERVSIKWPNDIYWGDKKIAGILIENAITGNAVSHSIAGIGLNVNQTEWKSDAPNPVSLKQITGKEYELDALMQQLFEEVQQAQAEDCRDYYKAHLYRREGFWPFVERAVNTQPTMNADQQAEGQFMARIQDILPSGEIMLQDQQGQERKYHFKQVRYVV